MIKYINFISVCSELKAPLDLGIFRIWPYISLQ